MNLFNFFKQRISINKIIVAPIFVGLLPNFIYILYFPNNAQTSAIIAFFSLFCSGFSGIFMIHYKKLPFSNIDSKFATFLGIFTSLGVWLTLLILIIDFYFN